MPAHRNHQFDILAYVDVFHPKHYVEDVDQVILNEIAFGVFEVLDVMNDLSLKYLNPSPCQALGWGYLFNLCFGVSEGQNVTEDFLENLELLLSISNYIFYSIFIDVTLSFMSMPCGLTIRALCFLTFIQSQNYPSMSCPIETGFVKMFQNVRGGWGPTPLGNHSSS